MLNEVLGVLMVVCAATLKVAFGAKVWRMRMKISTKPVIIGWGATFS